MISSWNDEDCNGHVVDETTCWLPCHGRYRIRFEFCDVDLLEGSLFGAGMDLTAQY